ncbi:uncharacterized protein [Haliotis asinina]|uniref:uncharacterized protein n=1 Tax=Haliotis asinina TaxID=109174 RepID=UPI003531E28F
MSVTGVAITCIILLQNVKAFISAMLGTETTVALNLFVSGKGYTFNSDVTYTRDAGIDGGYEEIADRGCARHRLVSYHREDENDGSYQEIEESDGNVDDIVPIVAVYSVMLTAVAVVVAAVTVLVCKDIKEV